MGEIAEAIKAKRVKKDAYMRRYNKEIEQLQSMCKHKMLSTPMPDYDTHLWHKHCLECGKKFPEECDSGKVTITSNVSITAGRSVC